MYLTNIFRDLFAFCETEKKWSGEEQIIGIAENMAEERLEDIPTDDYNEHSKEKAGGVV